MVVVVVARRVEVVGQAAGAARGGPQAARVPVVWASASAVVGVCGPVRSGRLFVPGWECGAAWSRGGVPGCCEREPKQADSVKPPQLWRRCRCVEAAVPVSPVLVYAVRSALPLQLVPLVRPVVRRSRSVAAGTVVEEVQQVGEVWWSVRELQVVGVKVVVVVVVSVVVVERPVLPGRVDHGGAAPRTSPKGGSCGTSYVARLRLLLNSPVRVARLFVGCNACMQFVCVPGPDSRQRTNQTIQRKLALQFPGGMPTRGQSRRKVGNLARRKSVRQRRRLVRKNGKLPPALVAPRSESGGW